MPNNVDAVCERWGFHVWPASVVWSTVPRSPTTQPFFLSTKRTSNKS